MLPVTEKWPATLHVHKSGAALAPEWPQCCHKKNNSG